MPRLYADASVDPETYYRSSWHRNGSCGLYGQRFDADRCEQLACAGLDDLAKTFSISLSPVFSTSRVNILFPDHLLRFWLLL